MFPNPLYQLCVSERPPTKPHCTYPHAISGATQCVNILAWTTESEALAERVVELKNLRAEWPLMAESKGFEPLEPFGSTVFKTAAFDHSANSPSVF